MRIIVLFPDDRSTLHGHPYMRGQTLYSVPNSIVKPCRHSSAPQHPVRRKPLLYAHRGPRQPPAGPLYRTTYRASIAEDVTSYWVLPSHRPDKPPKRQQAHSQTRQGERHRGFSKGANIAE
jgi:hypothetical protein